MIHYRIERVSPQPVQDVWDRLTRWERHATYAPITSITVTTPPPTGTGTRFVARTGWGRVAFDDLMEVTRWEPPAPGGAGSCRLEKRGRFIRGWAEIGVRPEGTGSRAVWHGAVRVRGLPGFLDRLLGLPARLLYGRVADGLLGTRAWGVRVRRVRDRRR